MCKNKFFESFRTKTEFYAKFRDENNNLPKKKKQKTNLNCDQVINGPDH